MGFVGFPTNEGICTTAYGPVFSFKFSKIHSDQTFISMMRLLHLKSFGMCLMLRRNFKTLLINVTPLKIKISCWLQPWKWEVNHLWALHLDWHGSGSQAIGLYLESTLLESFSLPQLRSKVYLHHIQVFVDVCKGLNWWWYIRLFVIFVLAWRMFQLLQNWWRSNT